MTPLHKYIEATSLPQLTQACQFLLDEKDVQKRNRKRWMEKSHRMCKSYLLDYISCMVLVSTVIKDVA